MSEEKKEIIEQAQSGKPAGGSGGPGGRPGGPGGAPKPMTTTGKVGLVVGIALCLIIWLLPPFWGLEAGGQHFLAILAMCITFWLTLPFPAELTALLLMILPWLFGLVDAGLAFSGWTSRTTWFIFGALLIGKIVSTTGLDKRIAYNLLSKMGRFGSSYYGILLSILIIAFLATFLIPSGTVMTTLLCALFFPFITAFGVDKKSNIGKAFMMIIPIIVIINGRMFLTGSNYNMVVHGILAETGQTISWLSWFLSMMPAALLMCFVVYGMFRMTIKPEVANIPGGAEMFKKQAKELGPISTNEKKGAALFLLAMVLWVTGDLTHISVNVVAVGVAILAMLPGVGVMGFREGIMKSNWPMIIFTAAVMGLPRVMGTLGVSAAFDSAFSMVSGSITTPFIFILVMWLLTQIGGWLGLGLAIAPLFLPVLMPVASSLGMPMATVVFMNTLMAPIVLFYHAPHPLIAASYDTFEQRDFAKYGFIVSLLWVPVCIFMYYVWWPLMVNFGFIY